MPLNRLDQIYRTILLSKYFVKGWGKPENLKRLFEFRKVVSNRDQCYNLIPRDYPVSIAKQWETSDCRVLEGQFVSPFTHHLPGLLPPEAENAHFQMILPKKWNSEHYKPVCLHMAGTGDHYYWRRRNLIGKPLLKEGGIGSIIIENPFYGSRKPKNQVRSILHNVSDIFVMGGCLILESLVLFHWCERQGLGPLGVTGLSMGGHMASLAATNWPKPLVLVPCLSWSTASGVFTEGVLSQAINWEMLRSQFNADEVYRAEIQKMVTVIEEDAFRAGQQFAINFPKSLKHVSTSNKTDKLLSNRKSDGISLLANQIELKVPETVVPHTEAIVKLDIAKKIKEVEEKKSLSEEMKRPSNKSIGGMFNFNVPSLEEVKLLNAKDRILLLQALNKISVPKSNDVGPENPVNWRQHEALHFMRGIMDECTHLRNFSVPVDTSLIIAVCARDDGYVPQRGVTNLTDIWPGAEVRYVEAGHVTAFLLYQRVFRSAIIEAFERAKSKYC